MAFLVGVVLSRTPSRSPPPDASSDLDRPLCLRKDRRWPIQVADASPSPLQGEAPLAAITLPQRPPQARAIDLTCWGSPRGRRTSDATANDQASQRTPGDHDQDGHARHPLARHHPGRGDGGLFPRRHRRARHRDPVLVGDHRPDRQRCDSPDGEGDGRQARHCQHGAAQHPAGGRFPERLRPHSASTRAVGGRRRRRVPPFHRAGAPRHGRHGPRLPGGLPHADAGARHAPAGGHRGCRRPRLQSLADRAHSSPGRAHQGPALPALQLAQSVRGHRQGLRRRQGRHRLHGHLHPQQARPPRSIHAALFDDPGNG